MRILVLTNEFEAELYGGSGRAVTGMVQAMTCMDISQTVVFPCSNQSNPLLSKRDKVSILGVPRSEHYFGKLGLIRADTILEEFPFLNSDWDLIHIHAINFAPLAYLLAQGSIPLIYTVHSFLRQELDDDGSIELGTQFMIQDELLLHCRRIHLISQAQKQYLITHWPHYEEKARVIPLGVMPSQWSWDEGSRPPSLLYVGRLRAYKGIEDLIRALFYLRQRSYSFTGEIVGGGDGFYEQRLRSMLRSYGLLRQVKLLGWEKAEEVIRQKMRKASLLVVPSRREAFGLTALEGMAVGVPLVVSNTEALVELTAPDCALIYPSGDCRRLASILELAFKHPELMISIGNRGRQKAARYYWPQLKDQYYDLYCSVLALKA